VDVLQTPLIMVLGHQACGAVSATIKSIKDNTTLPGHLPSLVAGLAPAVRAVLDQPGDTLDNAIDQNVRLTMARLQKATPILSKYVGEGRVRVVGGTYQLDTGTIEFLA